MKYILPSVFVLLLTTQTLTAQKFTFEKVPDWVKPADIPSASVFTKDDIVSGYYFTLMDYQVNLEQEAVFNHEVTSVISYGGITNASQISITYDTSYQKLKIHYLYVWRKGEKIDRTKDLSIEILNNEQELDQGIYTGQITAYDILNDIRKDDLIDLAYTIVGDNPIFGNSKYFFSPLTSLNPVDLYSIRVLYPADKDYAYRCNDCDSISLTATQSGDYKVIEVSRKNIKSLKLENNIPGWVIPFPYFILSSFHSWSEVYDWAQQVFSLDKEPVLDEVFKEIFTENESMDSKIDKIINYVQDDIRYMGIESGIGSIKPFPPEQVVRHRYGDCKDKSLLLVSLLKKIGIEKSYCALVNSQLKQEIDQLYPSNEIFNHCIVRFDYHDTTYWVDPTIAQQGGNFRNLFIPVYGKALVIGMRADTLQRMSPVMTGSGVDITEEYTVKSFTEPASLVLTSDRYGGEADQRRQVLEYYTTQDISEKVMEDLKLLFPKVDRTTDVILSDDMVTNHCTAVYNYELDDFWVDGDKGTNRAAKGYWTFKFEPLSLYQYLNETNCEERKYDYELFYPLNFRYRIVFNFPRDMLMDDDIVINENEVFYLEQKFKQLNSKSFEVVYHFRTKSDRLKAEEYKDICEQVNQISKRLPFIIFFSK